MNAIEILRQQLSQAEHSPRRLLGQISLVDVLKKNLEDMEQAYDKCPHGVVVATNIPLWREAILKPYLFWLNENVGEYMKEWTLVSVRQGLGLTYELRFKRSDDALHFKLRWVG